MKIAIIPNFPLSVVNGGFERQCTESLLALQRQGLNAEFLNWGDVSCDYDILHLFGLDVTWERLISFVAKDKPVVVSALAGSSALRWQPKMAKCFRAIDFLTRRRNSRWSILSYVARNADVIVCVNSTDQASIAQLHNVSPERFRIVPNGVPKSRFNGDPGLVKRALGISEYVLFVGSIIRRKNPLLLAEVLHELGLPGLFLGDSMSAEHEYGQKFSRYISSRPNLRWIKNIPYDDPLIDSIYSGCRLFVLPSANETQPLAALEAIAAGAPVLLADKGYAKAAPFAGRVQTTVLSKGALIDSVQKSFATVRRSQKSSELLSEFSWDRSALRLIEIYKATLEARVEKSAVR
jgi:glycosyltransferase involved in cell wall biosynthesis